MALGSLFLLGACATTPLKQLSLGDLVEAHETLDGARVRLTGWISQCENYSCEMFEQSRSGGTVIRVGYSPEFDGQLYRFRGREVQVEVEGQVHASCFDHRSDPVPPKDIVVCTDRGGQLDKPRLIRVITVRND